MTTPYLAQRPASEIAGQSMICRMDAISGIDTLWAGFDPVGAGLVAAPPADWFGVNDLFDGDAGTFRYTAAVETAPGAALPAGMTRINLPAASYMVFTHKGHVSGVAETWRMIWDGGGLAATGRIPAGGPCLELYGPGYDPLTGSGEIQIWIPVRA